MPIIGIIILAIILLIIYYSSKHENEIFLENEKRKKREREIQLENERKQKAELKEKTINDIILCLHCEYREAEIYWNCLDNTYNINDFYNAVNITERKSILKQAYTEYQEIQCFKNLIDSDLIPIIRTKQLSVPSAYLLQLRKNFFDITNLSNEEKLLQIDYYYKNEYNTNDLILVSAISCIYENSEELFLHTPSCYYGKSLSLQDINKIKDAFIKRFSLTKRKNYSPLSLLFDHSSLKYDIDSLHEIFYLCLYNSTLYFYSNKDHIYEDEYLSKFSEFLFDLFFNAVHYEIDKLEEILISQKNSLIKILSRYEKNYKS